MQDGVFGINISGTNQFSDSNDESELRHGVCGLGSERQKWNAERWLELNRLRTFRFTC